MFDILSISRIYKVQKLKSEFEINMISFFKNTLILKYLNVSNHLKYN